MVTQCQPTANYVFLSQFDLPVEQPYRHVTQSLVLPPTTTSAHFYDHSLTSTLRTGFLSILARGRNISILLYGSRSFYRLCDVAAALRYADPLSVTAADRRYYLR